MPDNRYPVVFIDIEMDPRLVDVNVHPAKWEIRLSKQKQLELLIFETIRKALVENLNGAPVSEKVIQKKAEPLKARQLHIERSEMFSKSIPESEINEREVSYDVPLAEAVTIKEPEDISVNEVISSPVAENKAKKKTYDQTIFNLRVIGSLHGSYILCEGENGLYIIDQHAAEERYHYEMFSEQIFTNNRTSDLLIPLELNADRKVIDRLNSINRDMEQAGIHYELFGDKIIVRSVPLWMNRIAEPRKILEDILDLYGIPTSSSMKLQRTGLQPGRARHR